MEQYTFLTLDGIITPARSEAISSASSNITALEDTQMIEWGETLNAMFVDEAHTRHHAGGWSWMKRVQNFKTVSATTLDGALSAGDATLTLTDASDFDSSGRIVIETTRNALDFVDYESKSGNVLTVSTTSEDETIGIAHVDNEKVSKLYSLPTDYAKTYKLLVDDIEYLPQRDARLFPYWRNYTQYGGYILFPEDTASNDITHHYYKKPATITALTDTTDIPTKWQRWAIEMTLMHLFRIRRKREDIAISKQLAEEQMDKAINYDQTFTSRNASFGISTGFAR